MPYAYKDKLSQSPITGGIEITQEQYQNAIKSKLEGNFVAVYDGELQELENSKQVIYSKEDGSKKEISILDEVPASHTTLERPDETYKFENAEWVIDPIKVEEKKQSDIKNSKQAIDTAAGNARQRYVSVGQMVEEEYRLALNQTKEWRAAGSPPDSVPDSISGWATAKGITDEAAATDIEQTAAYWDSVLLTIRQIRLSGKAAVDAAVDLGTHDDMMNVAQPYIDQLDAMQP